MAIKSLVVFLAVTAMLWFMADAAVSVDPCSENPSIVVTSLSVSQGYLPLAGGTRTIGGSLSVNVGTSTVNEVNVKVPSARVSVSFVNVADLCNLDELSEYCSSTGRTLTCSEFQSLLDVSGLCNDAGNFQNADFTMNDKTVNVPSVSSLSVSGTVVAQVQFKVGEMEVGCTTISIPIHN